MTCVYVAYTVHCICAHVSSHLTHTFHFPLLDLELVAIAAKEDEGVGSGYESDSESAVSCCTDDVLDSYYGNVYGESSDLDSYREMDRGSDSAAAELLGSPWTNGREEQAEDVSQRQTNSEHQMSRLEQSTLEDIPLLSAGEAQLGQRRQEDGARSTSTQPLPIVSLTPAGASDTDDVAGERQILTDSDREQDLCHTVDSLSGSPGSALDLLGRDQLPDTAAQRSDSSDSIMSHSRWKNPFLSSSPTSDFSLRQKLWENGGKESSTSTAERKEEDLPTFTLAIVSRRSRHRAGQWQCSLYVV